MLPCHGRGRSARHGQHGGFLIADRVERRRRKTPYAMAFHRELISRLPAGVTLRASRCLRPWATINHADASITLGAGGTIVHVACGTYIQSPALTCNGAANQRIQYTADTKWCANIKGFWSAQGNYTDIVGFDIQSPNTGIALGCNNTTQALRMFLGQEVFSVRSRRYAIFRSTVEHAVEKRANVIFTFHKQAHYNGLHSRLVCLLEFGHCTKKRH